MATILAHITIRAGEEARFEAVAAALYRSTHEQETGVRRYEYWRGSDPRTYYTLLSFQDFNAFLAHQTSDHHETAATDLGSVIEAIRLEWVDPILGAAPLVPTRQQDVADDADDLTKRYAERYMAQVASWWLGLRPETAESAESAPGA
jgi:quinol monooxygenase YgiN